MNTKTRISFLVILITALFIDACQEEQSFTPNGLSNSLVESARSWHREQTQAPGLFSLRKKEILTPIFSQAKLKSVKGGWTVLYAPAMGYELKNDKVAMLRGFVFSLQGNKITDGKIVEIYGTPEYIKTHRDVLLEYYIEFDLRDFTGSILTYDVNYRQKSGVKYENGTIQDGVRSNIARKLAKENPSTRTQDEYWVDVYIVHHFSDGSSTWIYMYSYIGGSPSGGGGGESPGGGSGDPGQGGEQTVSVVHEISEQIENPCLQRAYDKVTNQFAGVNEIASLLHQVFNNETGFKVTFIEDSNMSAGTLGYAVGTLNANGGVDVVVALNPNVLPNASSEITVAVIQHEIVHAWMETMGASSQLQQHTTMAQYFVESLINDLFQCTSNLPYLDAAAIVLSSFQDVWEEYPDNWADLIEGFGITQEQINQLSTNHALGNAGTPCIY